MTKTAGPLEAVLSEIDRAIRAELYYLAVAMTLTLPDICAALENEKAFSGKNEYKQWYLDNLAHKFPYMSDSDCYSLRCGVVHKGNLGLKTKGSSFTRVIFTIPHARRSRWHNCVADDALQFDAVLFCHDFMSGVRDWYSKACDDPTVQSNLPNLLQFRPQGLPPYMVGMPVIA
jgi:hypothetical protein